MSDEKPEYKVYRSRPKLLSRGERKGMDELREPPQERRDRRPPGLRGPPLRRRRAEAPEAAVVPPLAPARHAARPQAPAPDHARPRPALGAARDPRLGAALGRPLHGLRPDPARRPGRRRRPAAQQGPVPADGREHDPRARQRRAQRLHGRARQRGRAEPRRTRSCCCGIGGGANASLSIPRDTVVEIPGHGRNKINAAYAFGGPALATETVKDYLGIDINHVVEVSFENFPQLVDALGGVTYKGGCVVSKINGGKKNGGTTLRLKKGETEIDGDQALALARTRKNECAPNETDIDRARRQQQLVAAMKDKVTSFETFVRLPWVSWAAPQAIRSDMSGPTLLGVAAASILGGDSKPHVLEPSGGETLPDGGAGLIVDESEKEAAVARLLRG